MCERRARPEALAALSEIHSAAHALQTNLRRHARPDLSDLGKLNRAVRQVNEALTPRRSTPPLHRR